MLFLCVIYDVVNMAPGHESGWHVTSLHQHNDFCWATLLQWFISHVFPFAHSSCKTGLLGSRVYGVQGDVTRRYEVLDYTSIVESSNLSNENWQFGRLVRMDTLSSSIIVGMSSCRVKHTLLLLAIFAGDAHTPSLLRG